MSGVERVSQSLKCPVCSRRGEIIIEEHANLGCARARSVDLLSKGFKRAPKHDHRCRFGVCGKCKVEFDTDDAGSGMSFTNLRFANFLTVRLISFGDCIKG